jgi:hypothetical protein
MVFKYPLKIVSLYLEKFLLKFVQYNKFWKFYHLTFLLKIILCGICYEGLKDQAVWQWKNSHSTKKDKNAQKSLVTKPVSRRSQVFWYFEIVNEDSDFITGWEVSDQLTYCKRPKNTLHRSSTFQEKYCMFDLRTFNDKTQNKHSYMHLTFV